MDNLEPITRNEMFLNGDDLEPITREEMILAGADLEPITRHEWFLKKYRGGGGGGGYDLVNVPNLPADIASFNDGTDLPMASLKVAVTPYQDLSHGDPSPENICPIIGWDEAVVTVADDVDNPTVSHEYTIDLNGTRYGGTLDVTSGVLTVDRVNLLLNGLSYTMFLRPASIGGSYFRAIIPQKAISDADSTQLYSHGISNNPYSSKANCARTFESSAYLFVGFEDDMGIDTVEKFNQWLANNSTASICYKIKEPQTIQLTPTQVKSLEGVNNINANCGQITEVKYFKKA